MDSVNQTLPSGPAVSELIVANWSAIGNVANSPAGVTRPMAAPVVISPVPNQRLPSGPAVMGPAECKGVANSVTWPLGVMRPTSPLNGSVNQTLPSGPAAMALAPKLPLTLSGGRANSVMVLGTQRSSRIVTSGRKRNAPAGRTDLQRNSRNIAGSH